MRIHPWASIILFLFAATSQAAVTLLSVRGASNFQFVADQNRWVIYGGTAGTLDGDCSNPSNSSTCDNCKVDASYDYANEGFFACNTKRIHPNLILEFAYTSTTAAGTPLLDRSAQGTSIVSNSLPAPIPVTAGGTAIFRILWSELCAALATGGDCDSGTINGSNLRIGIDSNNDGTVDDGLTFQLVVHNPASGNNLDADEVDPCATAEYGVCSFRMQRGDEKALLKLTPNDIRGGFPNLPGLAANAMIVYYAEGGFANVNPRDAKSERLPITNNTDSFDLLNNVVTLPKNGTRYFFRIAVEDPAGNISHFTGDAAIADICPDESDETTCLASVRPADVTGLLKDDVNCFISTAAFGSSLHPRIQTLRDFRNQYLLTHSWGRSVVKSYYKYGPYAARWILESPWRQKTVQILLYPLWVVAWLSLNSGVWGALLVSLFAASGALLLMRRRLLRPTL